jgi:hypothetical protein
MHAEIWECKRLEVRGQPSLGKSNINIELDTAAKSLITSPLEL